MPATEQQQQIIQHDRTRHGRVVAGPGTGKSWTCIALLERLHRDNPEIGLGLLTFTKAATAELVQKVANAGFDWIAPGTIHSFALRLLVANPGRAPINYPIRIPDSWETENLIHPYIASQLRARGFQGTSTRQVANLEREMAARWESLDPNLITLAQIDPELRNTYVGTWTQHRERFGYVLLAEIPSRAGDLLEDHEIDLNNMRFMVVDEYQDLNRADIRLVRLVANRGVRILAIGDDDQSIYGFRMAAPEGLRQFHDDFDGGLDYPLSISMRCGRRIIAAATSLIETAPNRPRRVPLAPRDGAIEGEFIYLRFRGHVAEASGVAEIIAHRISHGVAARDIAVLVRSGVEVWATLLRNELLQQGIGIVNANWVEEVLSEGALRHAIALAHLVQDRADSLAWWTLFKLTRGIPPTFIEYVSNQIQNRETFGNAVMRLYPHFVGAPSERSRAAARQLVRQALATVEAVNIEQVELDEEGWGGWLKRWIGMANLSDEARHLLEDVGRRVSPEDGLGFFLSQLEPVGKDIANAADAIRIMSMSSSKGITVNTAIVMGVEAGIIPLPAGNQDEERRLLYVAMTRATDLTVLTAAARRTGATARRGTPNVNMPRGRCPLLANIPIGQWQAGEQYLERLRIA